MKKKLESDRTVQPGAGYRLLQKGEIVKEGDEYYYGLPPYGWHAASHNGIIGRPYDSLLAFRRKN